MPPLSPSLSSAQLQRQPLVQAQSVDHAYDALAARYLAPWAANGVTLQQVDASHHHWGAYRDPGLGGYVPEHVDGNPNCRVQLLAQRIFYVPCVGPRSKKRLARQFAMLELIRAVLDRHSLPDLDLAIALVDRPTVPRAAVTAGASPPLVFGYATTPDHFTVPFPYVNFAPNSSWRRLFDAQAASEWPPMIQRQARGVWRGRCYSVCDGDAGTSACVRRNPQWLHRRQLVTAAAGCPSLVDAALVKRNGLSCKGLARTDRLSMAGHAQFAYLVHVDGNGFSGRLDELLALGGVVLKQDSPYNAFYYPLLRAHEHYVPLASDLADLCATVAALREDKDTSLRLAAAAANFTASALSPVAVQGYVAALLRRYAALQRFTPKRHARAVEWAGRGTAARSEGSDADVRSRLAGWRASGPVRRPAYRLHCDQWRQRSTRYRLGCHL